MVEAVEKVQDGQAGNYVKEQAVVALQHRYMVRDALRVLGVVATEVDSDPRLDLALLAVPGVSEVAQRLREHGFAEPAEGYPRSEIDWRVVEWGKLAQEIEDQGRDPVSLDLLLQGLRKGFENRYSGWIPTMGKNRVVEKVTSAGGIPSRPGEPHVGGDGDVEPPRSYEAWAARDPGQAAGIHVGILDTRLFPHPWLAGAYSASPAALLTPETIAKKADSGRPFGSWAGHATFVAGLILKRAPATHLEVRAVPFYDDGTAAAWDVARELVSFAGSGVAVLNVSLCCSTQDGKAPLLWERAIDRLGSGVVVVAAAGNHGDFTDAEGRPNVPPMWPAALDDVLAVGATDRTGALARFSPDKPWVDLVAPGVELESTYLEGEVTGTERDSNGVFHDKVLPPFHGFGRWSGTSFSAAEVTGAIAAAAPPERWNAQEALAIAVGQHGQGGNGIQRFNTT